jgi:hypothetical protein
MQDKTQRELCLNALHRAQECNTRRNKYVHSEYLPFLDEEDRLVQLVSIPHKTRPQLYGHSRTITDPEDIDAEDVRALIDEVQSDGV